MDVDTAANGPYKRTFDQDGNPIIVFRELPTAFGKALIPIPEGIKDKVKVVHNARKPVAIAVTQATDNPKDVQDQPNGNHQP
ncbi:MAG: hypothetical protein Q8Q15_02225 [bacterium]|nr:hypothetical protein [bacterium]